MKKNAALIVSVILLIAIAATVLFLRSSYFYNRVEQKLVTLVENAIGRKIDLSDSHINIYPFFWQINNASLGDPGSGDALLTAKNVKIYLRPGRLYKKRILIEDIKFTEPVLYIKRYPDGKNNLKGLFPRNKPSGWKVAINNIGISKGRIQYNDLFSHKEVTLKAVKGSVFPDFIEKEIKVEITDAAGDYKDERISRQDLKLKGLVVFDLKQRKINTVAVKGLNILSDTGSELQADGIIGGSGSLDFHVNAVLSLMDIPNDIRKGKDLQGRITFKGKVLGSLAQPIIEGGISTDDLTYDRIPFGRVQGDLVYETGLIALSRIKGEILSGSVEGNMEIDYKDGEPSYHVNMRADSINPYKIIDRFSPGLPARFKEDGIVSGSIEGRGRGLDKDMLEAEGWITYKDSIKEFAISGRVGKDLDASLDIEGQVTDIAGYLRIPRFPLHGPASLHGKLYGNLHKPVISGKVIAQGARVKGVAFDSVTADLRLSEGTLYLTPVTLKRRDSVYNISGSVRFRSPRFKDPYFDLYADVSRGYPGDVAGIFYREIPLEGLKADGQMTFNGDVKDFSGTGELRIADGVVYGQAFDSGHVEITLEKDRVMFDSITVEREKEVVNGMGWIGFRGDYRSEFQAYISSEQFSLKNVDILQDQLQSLTGTGAFSISGSGKLIDPEIEAVITMPHLFIRDMDSGYAGLSATKDKDWINVSGQALDMYYDGKFAWERDAPFDLIISMHESNLKPFLAVLNPSMTEEVAMSISGEVAIGGKLTDPDNLQVNIILSHVAGIYSEYKVQNDGNIRLSYAENKLTFDSVRFKGEGTSLGIIGGIIPYGDTNVFISGEADLRLLALLTPEIKYGRGKAFVAFLISGEMNNPSIRGGLAVKDGTIRSTTLKQTIENAELSIFFNGREIVLESMQGIVGGGAVNASGRVDIKGFAIEEFGFVLEIANAVFRYPEGLKSTIDGTLVFQGTPESKALRGEVNIKKASYDRSLNIRSMILEVQRKRVKIAQPVPFLGDTELNIHIVGKKDIRINNNIAKLPVEVDLIMRGNVDHPLLFGRIEGRDGMFVFSRNEFKVISATADFVSQETIRPVIDIHATTEVSGYKVNLRLSGTVERFDLSLSSDPALSETDILALLTIGQTASEVSETMAGIGAVEATAFLAAPIQEKIENTLQDIIKIDRFQVDPYYSTSTASGGARLTVGKRLMDDRLYVTYTTGITTVDELIKMEYLLGRNVFLVGERDELGRMSGDIKFRFGFR